MVTARGETTTASGVRRRGLLVASSGGHLLQLRHLASGLPEADWCWIAFDTPDARHLLRDCDVVHAHHPTNRNIRNLVRNLVLAWRVVRDVRPRIVISTGAGVAVPFLWVARLRGARVIYVESFARTQNLSLTGRLVRPIAHRLFVQWEGAAARERGTEYVGSIF
jgi:UDP-N-acetylglucosamine:LPS N-acetylglucosamine transferase